MAVETGAYTTGTAKGIREDLTDAIYNLSPTKTPFTMMIGRGKAKATLHEWQQDSLAAADGANARPEGNAAAYTAPSPTVRIGNYCQISDKTAKVSGTLQAVDKAGRKGEMAYQLMKRSKELKRDVETVIIGVNQGADGSDPRKTAGFMAFLKTNISKGAGGADPIYTTLPTAVRTDGTQRAITEAMVKSAMQLAYDNGGEPTKLMVGTFVKTAISAFAGNATKTLNLAGAKPGVIVQSMDVIVTDFGNLEVLPNRFQRGRDAFLVDPEHVSLNFLRGYNTEAMAKTGDNEQRLLNVEYSLEVKNEVAHAAVYDLLTA